MKKIEFMSVIAACFISALIIASVAYGLLPLKIYFVMAVYGVINAVFMYVYIFNQKFRSSVNKTVLNLAYVTCFVSLIIAGYMFLTGIQVWIMFMVMGGSLGMLLMENRNESNALK